MIFLWDDKYKIIEVHEKQRLYRDIDHVPKSRIIYLVDNDGNVWLLNSYSEDFKCLEKVQNIAQISCGHDYIIALSQSGKVYQWSIDNPDRIKDLGLSGVVKISAGMTHFAALDENGDVWTWGTNGYGELGNGTIGANKYSDQEFPEKISISNITQIDSGILFTIALEQNGTLWSWGINEAGQLGLGDLTNHNLPQKVTAIDENITKISVGYEHTLALDSKGNLWGFGNDNSGQLVHYGRDPIKKPIKFLEQYIINDIFCNEDCSFAINKDDEVLKWGHPFYLYGNSQPMVLLKEKNILRISAGEYSAYILKQDNTLWRVKVTRGLRNLMLDASDAGILSYGFIIVTFISIYILGIRLIKQRGQRKKQKE